MAWEGKREYNNKNNNCRQEIEKSFKEKRDILKTILNVEEYQRLLHEKLQIEENNNLKRINDTILNRYIKNISTGTNNEPAPITNNINKFDNMI